jgi:hypothetical protein
MLPNVLIGQPVGSTQAAAHLAANHPQAVRVALPAKQKEAG